MARKNRISERTTDLPLARRRASALNNDYPPHDANLGSLIWIMLIAIKAVGFTSSACCGFRETARTTHVLRRSPSAATAGPMMPGCPISRRGSCTRPAASAAQTCGRISTGASQQAHQSRHGAPFEVPGRHNTLSFCAQIKIPAGEHVSEGTTRGVR